MMDPQRPLSPAALALLAQDAALPRQQDGNPAAFLERVVTVLRGLGEVEALGKLLPLLRGPDIRKLLWASHHITDAVASRRGHAVFDRLAHEMIAPAANRFIAAVNDSGPRDKRIVFVATRAYFLILRVALALRRRGHRVHLLTVEEAPADMRETYEQAFDTMMSTGGCRRLIPDILRRLDVAIIHVQCWMWDYRLARSAFEASSDECRVVCDFYDITSLFADPDMLASNWPAAAVELDLSMERMIARTADAVVHRFPPEVIDGWAAGHGAAGLPHLSMQAYPATAYVRYGSDKYSGKTGRPHLVYAGGLIPQTPEHPPELFSLYYLPDALESLLRQGCAVDLLHDPVRGPPRGQGYEALFRLAEAYETFRIRPGVAPHRLAEVLCRYDFGLSLTKILPGQLRTTQTQLERAMSTKLFGYLEAGLPIIVSSEFKQMADFVTGNGLGLALASKEIDQVLGRIQAFDYEQALGAIRRYNVEHCIEREIEPLIALYETVRQHPPRRPARQP